MKRKRLLTLLGSVCLALMLAVPLVASCGPATPEEATEEIAALESKLAAEKAKVSGLQGDVSDLEAEIAALRAPAEVYEWRFTSWSSPGSYYGDEAYPAYCQEIEDMTGGQITVEYIGAGALAGELGAFDAVRAGVVELGCPWVGGYDTILVEAKAEYGLPFGLRDSREVLTLLWFRGWEEILREAYSELDPPLYYLASDIWAPIYMMTNVPITSLDELGELKIRAFGSAAKYLEKLGVGAIVPIVWEELYTAIATGTIDGALGLGIGEYYDIKFYEFAKYIVNPAFISPVAGADYVVNMDAWNSLPEDLQAVIYGAAKAASAEGGVVGWTDYEVEGVAKMFDLGCSYTQIRDADIPVMVEMASELWDEVAAASPRNAEMMEIYVDYMRDLGYME